MKQTKNMDVIDSQNEWLPMHKLHGRVRVASFKYDADAEEDLGSEEDLLIARLPVGSIILGIAVRSSGANAGVSGEGSFRVGPDEAGLVDLISNDEWSGLATGENTEFLLNENFDWFDSAPPETANDEYLVTFRNTDGADAWDNGQLMGNIFYVV